MKIIIIVDTEGDVWCCGNGYNGKLGNGQTKNLYVPKKLNLGTRVIAVSAENTHSLFLCEDGTVQGCGNNKCGQIGLGHLERTLVPKTIEKLKKYKVIQISAGERYSAALTDDGILLCFGDNRYGQCGVGKEKGEYIKNPTKVDLDDEIEFFECSNWHTLIITRKGLFYSFGYGASGRLGHSYGKSVFTPTLIETLKEKRIKTCAAGGCHSLCIDNEGIIWSFGYNGSGRCGLSEDIKEIKKPKWIPWFIKNNIKARDCVTGMISSSVIANDGSLYLFGSNNNYRMGLKADKFYYTPTKLSIPEHLTVQSISIGSDHTAIICDTL